MAAVNFVNFAASLAVADDLELDPVLVEEVEAAAGFVVAVAERDEPGFDDSPLGGIQVGYLDSDMIEGLAFFEGSGRGRALLAVARALMIGRADGRAPPVVCGRPLPASPPAN